jgi:hypothetical protein
MKHRHAGRRQRSITRPGQAGGKRAVTQRRSFTLLPVVQEESTGCAIACAAALARIRYVEARRLAAKLGISATDSMLWSTAAPMRRLLGHLRIKVGLTEKRFTGWRQLPACALLAIKWHRVGAGSAWHWVLFVREQSGVYVLDPKKNLRTHRRTDFGRIKPRWFIQVNLPRESKRAAS